MTAERIRFKFDFPDLDELIRRERMNIQMLAAATLQTQRGMIFDAEGAHNGRSRWEPLQFRTGMILSRSGGRGLRGSIAPRNDGKVPSRGQNTILEIGETEVTIGSTLIYAEIHDQGGKITAKPGKFLRIPLPMGAWANDKTAAIQRLQATKQIQKLVSERVMTKSRRRQAAIDARIQDINDRVAARKYQAVLFRKSVKIPQRRYLDFTDDDRTELNDTLVNFCESLITAAGGSDGPS